MKPIDFITEAISGLMSWIPHNKPAVSRRISAKVEFGARSEDR